MEIYTIGYTRKTAAEFFGILRDANIRTVVDIRRNNSSQLAAFTKHSDLPFFLKEICGADYVHELQLAPTQEILDNYRKKHGSWDDYERDFRALLEERQIEKHLDKQLFAQPAVLLCSEPTAEHCHRRLVAEYLQQHWDDVTVTHL